MPYKSMEGRKKVFVIVPADVHSRLKRQNYSISTFVRDLILNYFDEEDKELKNDSTRFSTTRN